MNEKEQQINIAEYCGWIGPFDFYRRIASGKQLFSSVTETLHGTPPEDKDKDEDERRYSPVPDYVHDLNAGRLAELRLSGDEWRIYLGFLGGQRTIPRLMSMDEFHKCWRSPAEQRAEAFLRTIGKWRT